MVRTSRNPIPICRTRCQSCRAVFTVLPSFILRYRRQDADCLGKLLELNLGMGLSQRETATIYSWLGTERGWQPGWVWSLVQWLGNLMPVCLLLLRLGLTPRPYTQRREVCLLSRRANLPVFGGSRGINLVREVDGSH
jgi:hypothetical protein